jgi:hypothetical protein
MTNMDFIKNIFWDDSLEMITPSGLLIIIMGFFVLFLSIFTLIIYKKSCMSASIYNQQNNTSWTCSDFIWASKQINSNTQIIKIK